MLSRVSYLWWKQLSATNGPKRIYRLRQLNGTVDTNYVKIRLPMGMYGQRYPRFRQIWIQSTHATADLIVQIDESDSFSTIYHGKGFFDVSVSTDEGIEIQTLSLKGTAAATTYEIIIMYELYGDGLGLPT